ncbi:MAG: DASS family sodium-coupled anion symporter [Aeoliella sp.]
MPTESDNSPHEPRNLIRFWACLVVGVTIWFSPVPNGLNEQAWHVFAVFAATIVSFLLRPLPMGVCVLLGLLVLAATGSLAPSFLTWAEQQGHELPQASTIDVSFIDPLYIELQGKYSEKIIVLSLQGALKGFANTTVWLVVAAFLISGAMIHSGLGRRLALMMVAALGRTTLGLGYAIAAAEFLLGPFIPSNTARGGGVMMPIVNSICRVLGSEPHREPKRAGEYLVLCGAHLNLITAAMFLTGMAANPLVSAAAKDFLDVEFGWGMWIKGAIVPGLVSLALLPVLLYWLARPQLTDAREAQASIRSELKELGPWSAQQVTMAVVLVLMLLLWATGPLQEKHFDLKLPTALVALGGVATLVVLGVLPYSKVTGNAAAWDTLLWLGGLVTMAGALKTTGFVDWFASGVQSGIGTTTGIAAALLLAVVYFYSMYAFSMLTGHILALAGVFFTVAAALGAPPLVTVALVAYFSNLCGCTTNYSTGPVVIYFGLGYVPIGRWFWIGFLVSLFHLVVWIGVGLAWWKMIGWW